jgi:hypothetical protein
MKTLSTLLVVAVLAGGAAGCSSKKSYSANGTTVTTDNDQKSVTVTSKEGSMKIGKDAVDPSKLGVPIYPGAQAQEGGVSMTSAKGNATMVVLKTPDAFDKVYDFYKAQLPKDAQKMKLDQGDSSMAQFQSGDASTDTGVSIMITGKKDETDILITKGHG